MENSQESVHRNGFHNMTSHSSSYQQSIKVPLSWLDLKVFYVRVTKCEMDDSTPRYLTLNHIPLNPNTLLEVNGVRTSTYSHGVSSLLTRDRLDKISEEVTFVCTDSIRVIGSVKFEVFDKNVLVLSGVLEYCPSNGCVGESENHAQRWRMNCESEMVAGTGFLKRKPHMGMESDSPRIEIYVAGCFGDTPMILSKTVKLSPHKKQSRKGIMDSIPEHEAAERQKDVPSGLALQGSDYLNCNPENYDYDYLPMGTEYLEGEDGELSWFNAGVRVGVGIGLSICVGLGIGVGLLVRTYQGTARNFRRRQL